SNDATGRWATTVGGFNNFATGRFSLTRGGTNQTASTESSYRTLTSRRPGAGSIRSLSVLRYNQVCQLTRMPHSTWS
ncbi:MAG: hypothetical protein AAFV53_42000, partial [Myxococcota bacterium]